VPVNPWKSRSNPRPLFSFVRMTCSYDSFFYHLLFRSSSTYRISKAAAFLKNRVSSKFLDVLLGTSSLFYRCYPFYPFLGYLYLYFLFHSYVRFMQGLPLKRSYLLLLLLLLLLLYKSNRPQVSMVYKLLNHM